MTSADLALVSCSDSLGRPRIKLDIAARGTAVRCQRNRSILVVLDPSHNPTWLRLSGRPHADQHLLARRCIRQMPTIHQLVTLRAPRMKISHARSWGKPGGAA